MVVGVVAGAFVVCVGICEERFAACILDFLDYVVNEEWLDIVGISEFSDVQFYCYQIAFLYAVEGAGGFVKGSCFF